MEQSLEKMELFAWVGEDEYDGTLGLKQGVVPAGHIAIVSTSKEKLDKYWPQAEKQAREYGKRIYLVKFAFCEVLNKTIEGE
jgi:hypothetical protein